MPFEQYKQNVNAYLANFYSRYGKQLIDRPESSYQSIFDNEAASVNRYIQGVVDEIAYEVRERFEEKFGHAKADHLQGQFRSLLPKTEINGYIYQAKSYVQNYQPVRVSGGSSKAKQQQDNGKFIAITASGATLGTITGIIIGRTFLYSLGGFTLGGLVGSIAATILLNQKPKSKKRYISLSSTDPHRSPSSQPSTRSASYSAGTSNSPNESVQRQLDKRHQEVLHFIFLLIDQMERNYGTLIQSAG
ncbi:hypothetical protein HQN89_21860 [Paenibacillus frigoriresistens]|uniref:hypothetical protein n=1 Tax=Paenibacillus alginolyticus TaxID=59839 RepID=UPI001564CF95|nr:hypothetical protein [Paenibacillus frigoriresistens]NRF93593.1 hypothetical protein [Paenibacillus frigoriresistens]